MFRVYPDPPKDRQSTSQGSTRPFKGLHIRITIILLLKGGLSGLWVSSKDVNPQFA